MISDTLSEAVIEIRRYKDEPIFAKCYEGIEREIVIDRQLDSFSFWLTDETPRPPLG